MHSTPWRVDHIRPATTGGRGLPPQSSWRAASSPEEPLLRLTAMGSVAGYGHLEIAPLGPTNHAPVGNVLMALNIWFGYFVRRF